MLSSTTKRLSLPFSTLKASDTCVEAASVFAVADRERSKGRGLIFRQLEEKLVFLSQVGYPLWVLSKNNSNYVFDGFTDSAVSFSYLEFPSAKLFLEALEANSVPRERYVAFLSDFNNYFMRSTKEKKFMFSSLISNLDFKRDFNVYCREAVEEIPENFSLLSPTVDESSISALISEFETLKSYFLTDAETLNECKRRVNKATLQYVEEIDFDAEAAAEETNAKIRAQEEIVTPKIANLTKMYKHKITSLTESYDKELESLLKLKAKTVKYIQTNEGKIKLYQREVKAQLAKKHKIYEKQWKEKIKYTQKELNSLKKELKTSEGSIKKISKQKSHEITKLNFELDAEIKFVRQPILELESARDSKTLVFKQETDKLLKAEKSLIESLNKSIKLREAIGVKFKGLSINDSGANNSTLYYIPFYVACFEKGLTKRYLMLPPSKINSANLSAKLKNKIGVPKGRKLLIPRFKAVGDLVCKVQDLIKKNTVFENQLYSLAQRNNLLNNERFKENIQSGLVYLKRDGWLSDKEQQALINQVQSFF
jgi:hypothetical protein